MKKKKKKTSKEKIKVRTAGRLFLHEASARPSESTRHRRRENAPLVLRSTLAHGQNKGSTMRWTEDLQRALSARGLTVASIPGKGRGLVATRDFYPGPSSLYHSSLLHFSRSLTIVAFSAVYIPPSPL